MKRLGGLEPPSHLQVVQTRSWLPTELDTQADTWVFIRGWPVRSPPPPKGTGFQGDHPHTYYDRPQRTFGEIDDVLLIHVSGIVIDGESPVRKAFHTAPPGSAR